MLAVAGHDFVLVDCEHGSADLDALRHHVTAAESFGLPVLVRMGGGDTPFVLRALDLGVQGVVAPHVDSARRRRAGSCGRSATRRRASAASRRTPAPGRYGARSGEEHRRRADDVLVVAMLESPAAVEAAPPSLSVPGIDGYLIGTPDLGAARTADDPPLDELVAAYPRERPPGSVASRPGRLRRTPRGPRWRTAPG